MKITIGQLVGILVLVVVIGAAAYLGTSKLKKSTVSGKTRQAVFLSNSQVYFGYVSNQNDQYVTLKDIYYLQVQQPIQPKKEDDKDAKAQASLVKLGNELHGPKDEMRINREHILFIEDMKDGSKVNEAISTYLKNGSTATPTPAP